MGFNEETVQAVWDKGQSIAGRDPNVWRQDICHATMKRTDYGERDTSNGWEIDHIDPDGGDRLSNLQPLHWQNNAAKSDGRLRCVVTA